jgi:SET domain
MRNMDMSAKVASSILLAAAARPTWKASRCLTIVGSCAARWGLRCRKDLKAGAFVCAYVGDIITDEEAVRGTMHDDSASTPTCSSMPHVARRQHAP